MRQKENGYMTVEAAFWVPGIVLLLFLLIGLCSYLYQGCFMMQAAYMAAFRGSRVEEAAVRDSYTREQLDELLEGQVFAFSEISREVEAGLQSVTVSIQRKPPFLGSIGERLILKRTQKALCIDPVDYIRGIRLLKNTKET